MAKKLDFVVKISLDGSVTFLYHDTHPLFHILETDHKKIVRASNVRHDNDDHLWYVHECLIDGTEYKHTRGFVDRSNAIGFEIDLLEKKLITHPVEIDTVVDQKQGNSG